MGIPLFVSFKPVFDAEFKALPWLFSFPNFIGYKGPYTFFKSAKSLTLTDYKSDFELSNVSSCKCLNFSFEGRMVDSFYHLS